MVQDERERLEEETQCGLVLEQVQSSSDVIHLLQSSNVFFLHLVVKKVMFQAI